MRRLLVLLAAVTVVAVVVRLNGAVSASDVESFLVDRGWLGPIAFVVAMWVFQPLLLPGPVFMVPAALVWSAPTAMALSWVGNIGASFLAFAFARWVARDWAQAERYHGNQAHVVHDELPAGVYGHVGARAHEPTRPPHPGHTRP